MLILQGRAIWIRSQPGGEEAGSRQESHGRGAACCGQKRSRPHARGREEGIVRPKMGIPRALRCSVRRKGATRHVFRRPHISQPIRGRKRGCGRMRRSSGPTNRVRDGREGGGARSGLEMTFTKTRTVDTPIALDEVVPARARPARHDQKTKAVVKTG